MFPESAASMVVGFVIGACALDLAIVGFFFSFLSEFFFFFSFFLSTFFFSFSSVSFLLLYRLPLKAAHNRTSTPL